MQHNTPRKLVYNMGPIPGNITSMIRIWYKFIYDDADDFLTPQQIRAKPAQGILLHRLSGEGLATVHNPNLIQDEGVYHEYEVTFAGIGSNPPGNPDFPDGSAHD